MATEWKKIFIDLRAIKYDSAKLFLRQLENTLDLTKWINEGIAAGEINAISDLFTLNGLDATSQTLEVTENGTNVTLTNDGTSEHYLNIPVASATKTGKLSAADWIRFNNAAAATYGNLTSNSAAIGVIGGTGAVIGSGVTLDINAASGGDDGILLSSDWLTFDAKLGSASNGLTQTSTLVELGGALTKNTIITGNFNFEVNPYNNTLPPIFVGGSTAYVGVRTRTPATMLSSGSSILDFYDGVRYVAGDGLSWVNQNGSSSYIAAFLHSGASGHGVLARINNSDAATNIFNATSNTDSRFIVKGDGRTGVGTYSPITQLANTAIALNDSIAATAAGFTEGGQIIEKGVTWYYRDTFNSGYVTGFGNDGTDQTNHGAYFYTAANFSQTNLLHAVSDSSAPKSRFIVKGDGKIGIGIYTPLYKLDTLLGTSEAAYIRSTNISFNITDGSSTNGYFNLNTGSGTNASHRFNVTNYNNVNSVLNYADIVVSAFGGNNMMIRSYSSSAAHGALANTNHLMGDTLYVGSASTSGVTYLGGYTGSLGTVTFSSQVLNFNVNKLSNFSASTFNLNYAGVATVGASGAASALPAQPLGYVQIQVNGTNVKVPYYNV